MKGIAFRGKRKDWKKYPQDEWWVKGYVWIGADSAFIIPENAGLSHDEKTSFASVPVVEVEPKTVGQYSFLNDKNYKRIFEGDILEIFGMKGKVVQECGAFGVYFPDGIDYDLLESKIPYNNRADFCYNDNFISIWEFWWNYEQDDNPLYCAKIIGNEFDNPELL